MPLHQVINSMIGLEPDESFAVPPLDNCEELIGRITEAIAALDERTLQAYLLEQHLAEPSQFWELTSLLGPQLSAKMLNEHPRFFTTVHRCLAHFSRTGNAKEMVLALLELVDGFCDDALYVSVLPCLQNVLLNLPVKRGRSLELAMDTLGAHIASIPSPQNWLLEGTETKLLETDPDICRFLDVTPAFLDFMQPFLTTSGSNNAGDSSMSHRQWEVRVLKKHLLVLLGHPFVFLDLTHDCSGLAAKTYSRDCVEQLINSLAFVEANFYRLLQDGKKFRKSIVSRQAAKSLKSKLDGENADVEEMVADNIENEHREAGEPLVEEAPDEGLSDLSGACLAYLVKVESLGMKCWPEVISHTHMLHLMLPYVHVLLSHAAYTAVYKGLTLLSCLFSRLPAFSLSGDSLDDPEFMPMVSCLTSVMIHCPLREHRQKALSAFRLIFSKLESWGRYQLMKSTLTSCQHSGLKGVVVGMLKDEVISALLKKETPDLNADNKSAREADTKSVFLGSSLEQLLHLVACLPEGAASDLLDESDVIMATLNLFRFLVLCNPEGEDLIGIWNMLDWIEREYLEPLRIGLDMSVGHYQLEVDNITKKGQDSVGPSDMVTSVSVAGHNLPPMTKDQQLIVLHSALTTFDLIKCVLGRLCELISLQKNFLKTM